MPDQIIIENCSPTLAGLKTANLFAVQTLQENGGCAAIRDELREFNTLFRGKGVRAVPVRQTAKSTLIYLYRPAYLKRDLRNPEVRKILQEKGYLCDSAERCIAQLARKLSEKGSSFPHEIGLFLGYPPEDVRGFMQDSRKGVKCVGCWKVYGNKEAAERIFKKFRQCTETYKREYLCGVPLSKMIVRTA